MASVRVCDNCGTPLTPSNQQIAKIFLVPFVAGRMRQQFNDYTGHMDIGQCCAEEIVKRKRWTRRKAREKAVQNGG